MVKLLESVEISEEVRDVELDKYRVEEGTDHDLIIYFEGGGIVTFTLSSSQVKLLKKKGVVSEEL